jgi:hypothetical protein
VPPPPANLAARAGRKSFEGTALVPLFKLALHMKPRLTIADRFFALVPLKRTTPHIDCAVLAPPSLSQGAAGHVHVLVFHPIQLYHARRLAGAAKQEGSPVDAQSLRLEEATNGSPASFRLTIPELSIDQVLHMSWYGCPELVSFPVKVPPRHKRGRTEALLSVEQAGVPAGTIQFQFEIMPGDEKTPTAEPVPVGVATPVPKVK